MQVVEEEEKYDNFLGKLKFNNTPVVKEKNVQKEDRVIELSYLVSMFLP